MRLALCQMLQLLTPAQLAQMIAEDDFASPFTKAFVDLSNIKYSWIPREPDVGIMNGYYEAEVITGTNDRLIDLIWGKLEDNHKEFHNDLLSYLSGEYQTKEDDRRAC